MTAMLIMLIITVLLIRCVGILQWHDIHMELYESRRVWFEIYYEESSRRARAHTHLPKGYGGIFVDRRES
jgi:hypothetical protein